MSVVWATVSAMAASPLVFDGSQLLRDTDQWSSMMGKSTSIADRVTRAQRDLLDSPALAVMAVRITERDADHLAQISRLADQSTFPTAYQRDLNKLASISLPKPVIPEAAVS